MAREKIFIGQTIRDTRKNRKQTQREFAEQLGISTSYLNQLENNQRHVSATVLLALADQYSLDIRALSGREPEMLLNEILEVSKDGFAQLEGISHREFQQAIRHAPNFVKAFSQFYKTSLQLRQSLLEYDEAISSAETSPTAYEEVRDFYHSSDNYIDRLDRAGEELANKIESNTSIFERLKNHIEQAHGIKVVLGGTADFPNAIRRMDRDNRSLFLNPQLPESSLAFQIGCQIGLVEQEQAIDHITSKANFNNDASYKICEISLANYFAGSVVLPYRAFIDAAKIERYDFELLSHKFGVSLEQVCHRLSTLQRPGLKGIPFFFARVDQAGNITKRHSANKLQFARFGAACPLWNAHQAFEAGGTIIRQLAQTPDNEKYLSIAFEVRKQTGGFKDPVSRYAIAIGCEVKYLDHIVYADGLDHQTEDNFEPIGVSCRTCERKKCHQRSVPPSRMELHVDSDVRNKIPYEI